MGDRSHAHGGILFLWMGFIIIYLNDTKMKVIIKCILPLCLLACFTGCDDNNSLHQKYMDEGETLYTGKVDSVIIVPGNEKAKFSWQINADPRISKTVIYWNEDRESAEIPVNRTIGGILKLDTLLNITEGIYSFKLVTMDDEGHRSLGVERTVQIFGPKYISYLNNRRMTFTIQSGAITIDWKPIESPLIAYTTVFYQDYSDEANPVSRSVRIENEDIRTEIRGIRENDTFTVVTTYLPEGGLETLNTIPETYTVI
jgi:hypothetical protein